MISTVKPQVMTWYLEALADERGSWRTEINPFPFKVGRRESCQLRLSSASISGAHAMLDRGPKGQLMLADLGSTNGTFVNLKRVKHPIELQHGDVVHFADQEFRVQGAEPNGFGSTASVSPDVIQAMRGEAERRSALEDFIKERKFCVSFQPIVSLSTGKVFAYEALGRSVVHEFFANADEMFTEAKRLSLSLELSESLRLVTASELHQLPPAAPIFINTHPFELQAPQRFLKSLDEFMSVVENRRVVLEIHEMAITDVEDFSELRKELLRRNIALAFDDFGRGRSRLMELADLRPEYVKFDRATIESSAAKRTEHGEMIKTMVDLVHKIGRFTVAEGIETEEELDFCQDMGFDFGQGYLLGRPRPSDEPPTVDGMPLVR